MKKTIAFIGMTVLLAVSSTVGAAQITAEDSTAATITSPDGILSIEMPGEEWKEKEDSDFWFEITDGHNSIAIDHLGNGEMLPDLKMAGEENEEICQAFISTKNEVFIVTGQADSREGLADVIRTVGTLRILKYDTRTAVQKETQTDQATQSNINAVNATYYVTADELNVRADCSADSEAIGTLHKGEAVTVTGSVTEDGADTGWYQIQYQGRNGFVSSSFLSQTAPAAPKTDRALIRQTGNGSERIRQENPQRKAPMRVLRSVVFTGRIERTSAEPYDGRPVR